MRILLVTTVLFALLWQQGSGQDGFFNGLRNLFRPRRQNQFRNNRPPPPPRFQQSQNFQQPQSFQQPQNFQQSFQPQQQFNQFQQQQPFHFNQQQQFSSQPQQFRVNNQPGQSQQQTVFRNTQAQQQNQAQLPQKQCPKPDEGFTRSQEPAPFCADAQPNHVYNGKNYILTWLNGCEKFTGQQAEEYCVRQGGHAVSMDTEDKVRHFFGVAAQFAKRYYWTGGRINHKCGKVIWPSQRQEGWVRGVNNWSHTGGSEDKGPQPDNRDGNEICLAVLNNFYADGIKWHDVACHHRKPTICEL